jgi:hypothetical protein
MANAVLKILAMEPRNSNLKVVAQFNPKELQLDETIPWSKQAQKGAAAHLEYTSGDPRTMSFELLFDGFEGGPSVQYQLDQLSQMARPMAAPDPKRPPKLKVIWGAPEGDSSYDLPTYTCVLESLSFKYTMFSPKGTLLRATASVKLKEASYELKVGQSK